MAGYFILQVVINGPLALITHEVFPPTTSIYLWIAPLAYAFSYLIANFSAIEGFKYVEGSIGSLIGLAEILFGNFAKLHLTIPVKDFLSVRLLPVTQPEQVPTVVPLMPPKNLLTSESHCLSSF